MLSRFSRLALVASGFVCVTALAFLGCKARNTSALRDADSSADDPLMAPYLQGFGYEDQGLSDGAKIGRRVWYFATAGNARHHTYVLQQKLGLLADYYAVFGSHNRGQSRFKKWGVIPDPSCITAQQAEQKYGAAIWGDSGLTAETYGFDVCPGDLGANGLIRAIGKTDAWDQGHWRNDPACKLGDCNLHLGTSAGGMGFRKFPNPKFNPAVWKNIKGWKGYSKEGGMLSDASIEPPFLIGHACGSCHISYSPTHPPQNPEAPEWANIKGAVGAQYLHISELLGSGMPKNTIEWQMFTHARPGTSDTSAVTHDYINNPGTMNQIINFNTRPGLVNTPLPGVVQDQGIEFEAQKHTYKYFDIDVAGNGQWNSYQNASVPHVLKGGEDTVGAGGAVQRVYLNIGMCSEDCLSNHLSDLRTLAGRQSKQTPVRTDQCHRDCAEFKAVGKNVVNIFEFLAAQRPFDLHEAKGKASRDELANELGKEKVELGSQIFAANCARCHSSRVNAEGSSPEILMPKLTSTESEFYIFKEQDGVRLDWLGNDARTPVTEVGTYRCRALHTNHAKGHLWEQYASKELNSARSPAGVPELNRGGNGVDDGRGYYRNVSLLSAWAFAPFLHNNAIGKDLCSPEFPLGNQSQCLPADPSVEGRLKHFDAAFAEMFKPEGGKRPLKVTTTDGDIVLPFGPVAKIGGEDRGLKLRIPKGMPVTLLGSFDYRQMMEDMLKDVEANPTSAGQDLAAKLKRLYEGGPQAFSKYIIQKGYVNCGMQSNAVNDVNAEDIAENQGHEFLKFEAGAQTKAEDQVMNEEEYQALLAFMKLL